MFSFVLSECSDGPAYYNFLGDSIVELWDLNDNFPTLLTKNYGVAGSGIEYIRENAGCFDNQNLIILFGTNDLNAAYSDQDIENYVTQYPFD